MSIFNARVECARGVEIHATNVGLPVLYSRSSASKISHRSYQFLDLESNANKNHTSILRIMRQQILRIMRQKILRIMRRKNSENYESEIF